MEGPVSHPPCTMEICRYENLQMGGVAVGVALVNAFSYIDEKWLANTINCPFTELCILLSPILGT